MITITFKDEPIARFIQDHRSFVIEYETKELTKSITLSLPNTKRFYTYENRLPPYMETFVPEGYLYEIFKNLLSKEFGYVDDYLIFSKLAPNIKARIGFLSHTNKLDFGAIDLEEILQNDTEDTFAKLLHAFLHKNAISGVQPKTVALIHSKETLKHTEYIIKTWGEEYPQLALNEFFCLQACQNAGVAIPNIWLSKNNKFLVVENFTIKQDHILGFEEMLSLMDKNRHNKYEGSYEQIAKIIAQFSTQKQSDLRQYFKIVVMNYLLKNGDAHLKNFALLFEEDFSQIYLSPAYDIVNTVAYLPKDKPALTLFGKKIWYAKEALLRFGIKYCMLTQKEAASIYARCQEALSHCIELIEKESEKNEDFRKIATKMVKSLRFSLNQTEDIKELPYELTRSW